MRIQVRLVQAMMQLFMGATVLYRFSSTQSCGDSTCSLQSSRHCATLLHDLLFSNAVPARVFNEVTDDLAASKGKRR